MIVAEIGKIVRELNDFAIVAHTSPDGDSLGSCLGLYNFLIENNKSADVFLDGDIPAKYTFLPNIKDIKDIKQRKNSYSCLMVLDSGDIDRIGNCRELVDISELVINIDHHMTNSLFGQINLLDTNASSVGEMIYNLLRLNNFTISRNTAECIYTSILTDTGGFKYSNTTPVTMSIAGELMGTNINFTEINRRVFDIKTIPQVKLMSKVSSTLDITLDNKVALLYLTAGMLEECGAKEDDASEFINFARDIEGVEVAALIKEIDANKTRVSLRSKTYVDVSKIAEHFGGGGHTRASGCTIGSDIHSSKEKLLGIIRDVMDGHSL